MNSTLHRGVPWGHGRPGLFVPQRLDPTGASGPTRDEASGPGWRRTTRGRYVPADVERSVDQRVVEAAAVLPSFGGVTGWASLHWYGASWFDGLAPGTGEEFPVVVATGAADVRSRPGIHVTAERLSPQHLVVVDGLRTTTAARSLLHEMRYAPDVREAVVACDMAACHDVVSLAEAWAHAATLPSFTGIPQARTAMHLADENSWSPWETRLRLVWVLDARLPPPLCNVPVFDLEGHHLGTPDLFDPVAGLAGQYDGGHHLARAQRRRDLLQEERLRAHGVETVRVFAEDVRNPPALARRLGEVWRSAPWRPPAQRGWTTSPPPWWHAPRTVEGRRAARRLAQEATG